MTRKKSLIRKRGAHTAEAMLRAVQMHRNGESLRSAAKKCNIKFTTLRRYAVKYASVKYEDLKYQRLTPNYSINKVFSLQQEELLKTFLKEYAAKFDGVSTKEIRRAAFEMALAYKIDVPDKWTKNNNAGIEWYRNFKARHADLSVLKTSVPSRELDEEALKRFCETHAVEVTMEPVEAVTVVKQEIEESESENEEDETSVTLWSYFERESNGRACCAVCRAVVPRQHMRSHLRENHPKLVFEDVPLTEDEASETQDDVYTEIVYLEDEQNTKRRSAEKKKHSQRQSTEFSKPKKRRVSSSSDEEPLQKRKDVKAAKEDEIEQFGKYVTCLLKKVPPEACMELQMEIVNLIMKKQLELKKAKAERTSNGDASGDVDCSRTQ